MAQTNTSSINFLGYSGYGYLITSTTNYSDSYRVSYTIGFHNSSYFWKGSAYVYGYVNATGQSQQSGSFSVNSRVNAGNHTIRTGSFLWNKGTSAASKTVSCKVSFNGSYGTTSQGFTVPALQSWTVSYDPNGGVNTPASQHKYYNKTLVLSSVAPTKKGYTFVNWNTSANGTGTTYTSGATYTGNATLTLYATWAANSYTLHLDGNNGKWSNETTYLDLVKVYDSVLTLPSIENSPTRQYYKLLGWVTDISHTTIDYEIGGEYSENILDTTTLYALWKLDSVDIYLYAPRYKSDGTIEYYKYQTVLGVITGTYTFPTTFVELNNYKYTGSWVPGSTTTLLSYGSTGSGIRSITVGATAVSYCAQYSDNIPSTVTQAINDNKGFNWLSTSISLSTYFNNILNEVKMETPESSDSLYAWYKFNNTIDSTSIVGRDLTIFLDRVDNESIYTLDEYQFFVDINTKDIYLIIRYISSEIDNKYSYTLSIDGLYDSLGKPIIISDPEILIEKETIIYDINSAGNIISFGGQEAPDNDINDRIETSVPIRLIDDNRTLNADIKLLDTTDISTTNEGFYYNIKDNTIIVDSSGTTVSVPKDYWVPITKKNTTNNIYNIGKVYVSINSDTITIYKTLGWIPE